MIQIRSLTTNERILAPSSYVTVAPQIIKMRNQNKSSINKLHVEASK